MMRWMLVLMLMIIPSAVFAQEPPPRPAFYVYMTTGEKTELVKIEPLTVMPEAVAEIDPWYVELPLTIDEAMPEVEVKAFHGDLKTIRKSRADRFKEPGVSKILENLWALKENQFLLHRNYFRCGPYPDDNCYGYTEFSLLDTSTDTERVLWTLPYHDRMMDDYACYADIMYEGGGGLPIDVQIHPTQDLVAITVNARICDSFLVLIDYSTEVTQVQKRENIVAMSWSPDGMEMAYTEWKCEAERCLYEYGRMVLETGEKTPFQLLDLDYALWMMWLDTETIVYARPLMPSQALNYQVAVVWHKLTDHSEVVKTLAAIEIPNKVFRVSADQKTIMYSTTQNGETAGWNTILTDDPSDTHQAYQRIRSGNSRNTRYAVALVCSGVFWWCEESQSAFIDAYGSISLMNLDHYRELYGADSIGFAAIAAEQP